MFVYPPIKFVDNHKKQKTNHSIWKGVKMGIIANYKYLSDKNLKELKAFYSEENETFEETEEQNGDVEILLDLDKMWDALHSVLTGASSSEPIKKTLLVKRL